MYDYLEEHEAAYSDAQIRETVNYLCDVFDDVFDYFYKDRYEFSIDVFKVDGSRPVNEQIKHIIFDYTDIAMDSNYGKTFKNKYADEKCETRFICKGDYKSVLLEAFAELLKNIKPEKNLHGDEKLIKLINDLCKNVMTKIPEAEAELQWFDKFSQLFEEFNLLIFRLCFIKYGDYVFLLSYGTSD